jgi:hypothetical protein
VREWGEGSGFAVRPNGEMRGKWGKCDLKAGHGRPSSSAFDRT